MIKNKQFIKILCTEITCKLELMKELNRGNYNCVIENVIHSGLDLMNVLKEEIED